MPTPTIPPPGPTLADVERVARRTAARYARRCWWADPDDLAQEARLVGVRALQKFDPRVGVPFDAYVSIAAARAVGRALLKDSAPVSAPKRELSNLIGLHRSDAAADHPGGETPDYAAALDRDAWRRRAQRELWAVFAVVRDGELAAPVLLAEQAPVDVAAAAGVRVQRVYKAIDRAKRVIRNDAALWRLWKEQTRDDPDSDD